MNGASASLLFNGSAITVYGATSTDYGLFSVSLDGSDSPLLLNGSAPMFRPQNMLVSVLLSLNTIYAVRDEAVMTYVLYVYSTMQVDCPTSCIASHSQTQTQVEVGST